MPLYSTNDQSAHPINSAYQPSLQLLSWSLQLIVIHEHTFLSNAEWNSGFVTSCDIRDFCVTADWLDLPTPLEGIVNQIFIFFTEPSSVVTVRTYEITKEISGYL